MQKQSYELISNVKKKTAIHSIIYQSNYPKIFFFLTVTLRVFIKVANNKDIKIVHANDGLMALFITPLLLIKRVKLCATIHGLDVVFNVNAYQCWVKKYLSRFTFLVAVSDATKKECIKRGVPKERVFCIPNAVELPEKVEKDPSFFGWVEDVYGKNIRDSLIISSVGRPVPRKGFGWFCEEVLPKIPDAKYLVVGTKIDSSWLISSLKKVLSQNAFEKLSIMLGVPLDNIRLAELAKKNDQLILLGKVAYENLLQVYLHTDIFAMPNRQVAGDFEGFGLVALEAGSLGAVCIGANVDGIPSAIKDQENGYLLESGNTMEWIEKINFLKQEDRLAAAKESARQFYESKQPTWQEMSDGYLKLFKSYL